MAAPRIYNLFPLLAGTTRQWAQHLPRIAAMQFDWVYLNPVHYPGFSGSLYAIKDPEALHPLFQGDSDAGPDRLLADFVQAAEANGLKVMLDLVVNHTAKDARLAQQHPEWYYRQPDGSLRSPGAADASAPDGWIEWGDLAELDYSRPISRDGLVAYWSQMVQRLLRLGIKGFRCDAAYQVPAEAWQQLIAAARAVDGDAVFCAETLGCTPDQITALESAGFDYVFNSSKWWDFRADWLLDQYEQVRHIAPSIAFPESHDTPRLITEAGLTDDPASARALYQQRYLFAAAVSAGVMMPMGFEFGFRHKLDVVATRPDWWEAPAFDLSNFVAAVNALKAATPALQQEGPQRRLSGADDAVCALLRQADDDPAEGLAVTVINTRPAPREVGAGWLLAASGGDCAPLTDATPGSDGAVLTPGQPLWLDAHGARLALGAPAATQPAPAPGALDAAAAERLAALPGGRVRVVALAPADGRQRGHVGAVVPVTAQLAAPNGTAVGAALDVLAPDAETPMAAAADGPDDGTWRARLALARPGLYHYRLRAWLEPFRQWQRRFAQARLAGTAESPLLQEGRDLLDQALGLASGVNHAALSSTATAIDGCARAAEAGDRLLSGELAERIATAGLVTDVTASHWQRLAADRRAARSARWYRLAPWPGGGAASTAFADAVGRAGQAAAMGFDTLLLGPVDILAPPETAGADGPPGDGLVALIPAVRAQGLEPALAVRVHGAGVDQAESFESACLALRDSLVLWVERGVRTLRLADPGAVPSAAWHWVLGELQRWRSDLVVCAGWDSDAAQAAAMAELGCAQAEVAAPFDAARRQASLARRQPQAVPPEPAARAHARVDAALGGLAFSGDYPAFMVRACLAAFLAPVYSIYEGFEDGAPPQAEAGRGHGAPPPGGLAGYLARLHAVVDAAPALHDSDGPRFFTTTNEAIAWFGKWRPGDGEAVFVALCLTPRQAQGGWVALPVAELGLADGATVAVTEAFSGNAFTWQGVWQRQDLDPGDNPAALFHVAVPGL